MKVTSVISAVFVYLIAMASITAVTWLKSDPTKQEVNIACFGIVGVTMLAVCMMIFLSESTSDE